MIPCLFVSDLHGSVRRYRTLLTIMAEERPAAVLLGGDLFPAGLAPSRGPDDPDGDFLAGFLLPELAGLRERLGSDYPEILLILGNDDPRADEPRIREAEAEGLWHYVHGKRHEVRGVPVYGYGCVPPTPFLLKDWECYDVSRYVPPGCVSPEEGWRTVEVPLQEARFRTIRDDLASLVGDDDVSGALFLFHTPPAETKLDRAALDGRTVDHVPLDVHVGSIAVRRFIEERQPLLTLHGHIHESARIMGSWRDRLGRTHLMSAAHDGPELALVRFDLEDVAGATRTLV
ncbi:MAG TPA: metallophosphoesterase [Longimicrobiales bacterium]